MKTKKSMDPAAAFADAKQPPGESELKAALGPAGTVIETVLARLRSLRPEATTSWQFSERSGWYLLLLLKKRRLLYLVPKRGDFRFSMILGDKAIALLRLGPVGPKVESLLKKAKRYPEGTAFTFERKSFDPETAIALLEAKIKC
jgi:hypothetical protein